MPRSAQRCWTWILALTLSLGWPSAAGAFGYYWEISWGGCGHTPGLFDLPMGVATGPDGFVYVVDRNTDRVQKFDADGNHVAEWEIPGSTTPFAVAVDDGFVYVLDQASCRVIKFTTSGGFVLQWGSAGTGDGQFNSPLGLAIGPDHSVYISDTDNHRIQKFTSSGAFLLKWGSTGAYNGSFNRPRGMVVDPSGTLYVVDEATARVNVFSSQGVHLTQWGQGQLGTPTDIDRDAEGNFYISDAFYHQISKYSAAGEALDAFGTFGTGYGQFRYPYSVAVNGSGQVYATDYQNCRVQRFGACPILTIQQQPVPRELPYGASAVFSVSVPNATSYQWMRDDNVVIDGGRVSGAETATLVITGFQAGDEGTYWVTARNVCNQGIESDHVALSLAPPAPTCFGPSAPPPSGMAAWWAMDPGPGNSVPDVLNLNGNKNHASLTGAASLVSGKVGTAVRCNGVNDGLHVPNSLSPRLAAASTGLSIDAWILPRSGSSVNAVRMILQKGLMKKKTMSAGGLTALAPGYAFYLLDGGRLGFQMPNPDYEPVRFEPAMATMSMDEWHHVAVTVQPQVVGGGKFYLDGVVVGSFTPPSGILGNLADLYIGRFTPQLGPATPDSAFNGDIDEVELFVTAIDSASVRKIWSAGCSGKQRVQALLASVTTVRSNLQTDVCFAVQNLSKSDRNYAWSLEGASTPGCPSTVPVVFTPNSGSILVPAGARVDLSSTATLSPPGAPTPFARCYTLAVTDLSDNGLITASSALTYSGQPISAKTSCTPPELELITSASGAAYGGNSSLSFTLYNDGVADATVPYSVRGIDAETGGPSHVLRVNGQQAGVGWTGSQFVAASSSVQIAVNIGLDEYEPLLRDQVVLAAALDGDLIANDELASTHVVSTADTALALLGVGNVPALTAPTLTLHAAPNPFSAGTALSFRLRAASSVEVDVTDVMGRRVRRMEFGRREAGEHRESWDGRDDYGAALPIGFYLARIRASGEAGSIRLLRIR